MRAIRKRGFVVIIVMEQAMIKSKGRVIFGKVYINHISIKTLIKHI